MGDRADFVGREDPRRLVLSAAKPNIGARMLGFAALSTNLRDPASTERYPGVVSGL